MNAPETLPMRQEFGATQMTQLVETSASAVAAQAKAMVESRYVMAMRQPRDWDQVRQSLLRECRRPAFARNTSAFYIKPIGKGVEGLGIRFVEVALRCMKNVLIETSMVFEDSIKEVHRVSVTDLESNVTYPLDIRVSKTVERSKPMDDGSYISVRMNSFNKSVYTVPANDDDLLNKRGALISKAVRTLGLRIIPGDLQDEAEEIIKAIRKDEAASNPDDARKKIIDAFGDIGVKASELVAYVGHSLDQCSPSELVDLRGIYGAIKDGESTWKSVVEWKAAQSAQGDAGDAKPAATSPPIGYPAESFTANLPKWTAIIASGKKTADQIIETAQTKGALSDQQKATLRAIVAKPQPKPEPAISAPAERLERIRAAASDAAISDSDIMTRFNLPSMDAIPEHMVDHIMAFISDPTA